MECLGWRPIEPMKLIEDDNEWERRRKKRLGRKRALQGRLDLMGGHLRTQL